MDTYLVEGLTKIYPGRAEPANDRIDLRVAGGEVFGLLGDNGAGKSTLVRQMVGLLRPTEGGVRLFGRDVLADPTFVALRVGYMPQSAFALNHLRVAEPVYLTAHLRGLTRRKARAERDELVDRWGLGEVAGKVNRQLSGGHPFAALGAWIGTVVRTPEESGSVSLVASVLMTAVGPVVVAPRLLPGWLTAAGWINPAAWAASALRQALLGPVTARLLGDLAVLGAVTVAALWLVNRRLRWRAE